MGISKSLHFLREKTYTCFGKKLKEDDFDIDILEEKEAERERVFVLSVFPEFLVDYFGIRLWKTCVKHTKNRMGRRSYGVGDKTF